MSLSPQQRNTITSQLNDIRAQLHALEIPSEGDLANWKALFVEKRRLERMLAENRWLDESDDSGESS